MFIFKLVLLNLVICFYENLNVLAFDYSETSGNLVNSQEEIYEILPESETIGACSRQSNLELHQRNCRYGKCEQIKNGTDYACHCEMFITGRRCDRPATDPNDACSSNPCWGESLCITMDTQSKEFKCLCPAFRRGKYCHIRMIGPSIMMDEYDPNLSLTLGEIVTKEESSTVKIPTHKYSFYSKTKHLSTSVLSSSSLPLNHLPTTSKISVSRASTSTTPVMTIAVFSAVTSMVPTARIIETTLHLSTPISTSISTTLASTDSAIIGINSTGSTLDPTTVSTTMIVTNESIASANTSANTSVNTSTTALLTSNNYTKEVNTTTLETTTLLITNRSELIITNASIVSNSSQNLLTDIVKEPRMTSYNRMITNFNATRGNSQTIVPSNENLESCNMDTCQLGKCLKNGTCECVHPAIGKYCDRIDECLVLKCVHGYCITGKGCVCSRGFSGTTCEIPITTTLESTNWHSSKSQNKFSRRPFGSRGGLFKSKNSKTTTQAKISTKTNNTKSNSTLAASTSTTSTLISTTMPTSFPLFSSSEEFNSFMFTKSSFYAKSNRKNVLNTTPVITSCENGGLFIDNVCICLNQFSGLRCQIAPGFSEQVSTNIVQKDSELDQNLATIHYSTKFVKSLAGLKPGSNNKNETNQAQLASIVSKVFPSNTPTQTTNEKTNTTLCPTKQDETKTIDQSIETEEDDIPLITINRYTGRKAKNGTMRKSIVWPWFECFPGDSKVTVEEQKEQKIVSKRIADLNVNDRVLVVDDTDKDSNGEASIKFSNVVTFLHRIENIDANFIRLHFDSTNTSPQNNNNNNNNSLSAENDGLVKGSITLTPKHLILVMKTNENFRSNDFDYLPAKEVKVGDLLKFYDYKLKLHRIVTVFNIEPIRLRKSGIYAPLTETGTLIVDNIYVSCYSLVKSHKLAQFFFSVFNKLGNFVTLTSDSYNTYSKILYEILTFAHLNKFFLDLNL